MNESEIYEVMNTNPVMHIATIDNGQPRVRAMFLYKADSNGIIFHTGKMKDIYAQVEKNPAVEICFNDLKNNIQIRVSGILKELTDTAIKDEICAHPSRAFLRPWRESGPLQNFYDTFRVFSLSEGNAICWTFADNFKPKISIPLFTK